MPAPQRGFLLIADITGYTSFLTASELDHARGILEELFSAMLAKLQSPFMLSNVQGDAIFAYARADLVSNGHTVVNTVEALYFGFAHQLQQMMHNTTCTCAACRNIKSLDLKLFVHSGAYVEQSIGGRTELGGPDVILVHRLLKNSIAAGTGISAYAAFTEASVAAINLPDYFADLPRHTEAISGFPDVALRILDMQPVWADQRARTAVFLDEDTELFFPDVSKEIEAPPDRAWSYVTDPAVRAAWFAGVLQLTRLQTDRGRLAPGTVDHCAHGDGSKTVMTMLDVRPNDYFTFDIALPFNGYSRCMVQVTPSGTGSRVLARTGRPTTTNPLTRTLLRVLSAKQAEPIRQSWVVSFEKLAELAKSDSQALGASAAPDVAAPEVVKSAVSARFPA